MKQSFHFFMIMTTLARICRNVTCSFLSPSKFRVELLVKSHSLHVASTSRILEYHYKRGQSSRDPATMGLAEDSLPQSHTSRLRLFSSKENETANYKLSNNKLYVMRFYGESNYTVASASCGIALYDSETSKLVWKARMYLNNGESAQEAEYFGIQRSLEYIVTELHVKNLIIQGDEKGAVLNQLKGKYQISNQRMKYTNNQIQHFLRNHLNRFEILGIPSDENRQAKKLARIGLEKKSSYDELCIKSTQSHNEINNEKKLSHDELCIKSTQSHNEINHGLINLHQTTHLNNDVVHEYTKTPANTDSSFHLPVLSGKKMYVLRFDGGSRGNPGFAGCGMVLFDSETQLEVWSSYKYLGETTNNVAEYTGLLEGLKLAKELGINHLIAEGDSTLVVKQMNGEYKVKTEHLIPIYNEALSMSKQFQSFKISYIPREENFRADQLANIAMDEKS